jgi:hypothetical protein
VRHEPGKHQIASGQGLEPIVEIGLHEAVRKLLDDHRLVPPRRHLVDDLAGLSSNVVGRTVAAVVLEVDDRDPGRTSPLEQLGR